MLDGIYFGLDAEVYHAQPRLSASGIKNMIVSPLAFWAESWMNPRRKTDEDPDWAIFGRAQHTRVCEGKTAFNNIYACQIEPADYPGALVKLEQLKAKCAEFRLPVSGTKEVLSERLRQFGCQSIWDDIRRSYEETQTGKVLIPKDWVFDIEIAAACVEKDPTISKCFLGGYPEISVFWTAHVEKTDGSGEIVPVPMKSRFDFLKPKAIVDVKTYSNMGGKSIKRAITYEIAARRYAIQASVYYDAFDVAQTLIRQGAVFGTPPPQTWLDQMLACQDPQFVFVFMQKGPAPIVTGWIMPRHIGLMSVSAVEVREAQLKYAECLALFTEDPWIISSPIEMLGDGDIPSWASE